MRIKTTLFAVLLSGAILVSRCPGQEADKTEGAMAELFTGRIVFHQDPVGHVAYEVTVVKGIVTDGAQHIVGSDEAFAKLVGGWYDGRTGRLSLLVQCTSEDFDPKWRSQLQQFHVDLKTKQVTLEHMLYGYGLTVEEPNLVTGHALDSFEGIAHLVAPAGAK